jgi:translation elongation factor EF-4
MKKYKAQHFEVSASSGDNVNEMFNSIVESISEGQEKRKNKFKDLEIPVSSLDIYPAIMSSDRAGRQNTESQLTLDIQNQGKKAGRKKITQKEDFEEETFVAEAVPCWKRCCNFCGK